MANQIDLYRLPQPVVTLTPTTGGTLSIGVPVYYKVVPWGGNGNPSAASVYEHFNGPASLEVSFTPDATNRSCSLAITNPDGMASGWHIFRSTVSGSYLPATHLAFALKATPTYIDTGIATIALVSSYCDEITVDMPLINVRGHYKDFVSVAGTHTLSGNTLTFASGTFIVNEFKDRVIYFFTDRVRFVESDGISQLRYAKVRTNTASSITFETPIIVAPLAGDVFYVSWLIDDVYDASVAGAWGNIASPSYFSQGGKAVIIKNSYKSYQINATLYINWRDAAADHAMFGWSRETVEFGQACRFFSLYNAVVYCGNCNSDIGSGFGVTIIHNMSNFIAAVDTLQSGHLISGEHDITGMRLTCRSNYPTSFGNDAIQPTWGGINPPVYGKNRVSGCAFEGLRASTPAMSVIFKNNSFNECGQAIEATNNEADGLTILDSRSDAIRCSSVVESRFYNLHAAGPTNLLDMYASDTDATHLINPSIETVNKILGSGVADSIHWEVSPSGGAVWLQYQMGALIKNAVTGLPEADVIMEVFDKTTGLPIYAEITDRKKTGKLHYAKGVYSVSNSVRNLRGAWYPKVKTTEILPAVYIYGRYYGYSNAAMTLTIGNKDPAVAGKYGDWNSGIQVLPAKNFTGWNAIANEIVYTFDPTKTYLAHQYGDFKYVGYITQVIPTAPVTYDGLGFKTITAEEGLITLPTGYAGQSFMPYMKVDARRFYSDALGVIPLLDFNAMKIMKGTHTYNDNVRTYLNNWEIRFSKVGFKTVKIPYNALNNEANSRKGVVLPILIEPGTGFAPVITCDFAPAINIGGANYMKL